MRIEESILINRPPQEVFAFFEDRRNDERWMGGVEESTYADHAETTDVGRRGRMVMEAMGRREFDDVVTVFVPDRKVAHRFDDGSFVFESGCDADPEGSGTRATVWLEPERLPGGMFGRLLAPMVARATRKNFRADLERLKALLEAPDSAQRPG